MDTPQARICPIFRGHVCTPFMGTLTITVAHVPKRALIYHCGQQRARSISVDSCHSEGTNPRNRGSRHHSHARVRGHRYQIPESRSVPSRRARPEPIELHRHLPQHPHRTCSDLAQDIRTTRDYPGYHCQGNRPAITANAATSVIVGSSGTSTPGNASRMLATTVLTYWSMSP